MRGVRSNRVEMEIMEREGGEIRGGRRGKGEVRRGDRTT